MAKKKKGFFCRQNPLTGKIEHCVEVEGYDEAVERKLNDMNYFNSKRDEPVSVLKNKPKNRGDLKSNQEKHNVVRINSIEKSPIDVEIRVGIESSVIKAVYDEFKNKGVSIEKIDAILDNGSELDVEFVKRLQKIKRELIFEQKNRYDLTVENIDDLIGGGFYHVLYDDSRMMSFQSFKNLELLYGSKIPHQLFKGKSELLSLPESGDLFEVCGIILGDGYITVDKVHNSYVLGVALNWIDERRYVDYVKTFFERFFNLSVNIQRRKKGKGVSLLIYSVALVEFLLDKGLKAGNKVEQQVGVPEFIKKGLNWKRKDIDVWHDEFQYKIMRCIKGLFDTDGSVFVAKIDKSIGINFTSGSKPLVEDFKLLCNSLDIKTSSVNQYIKTDKRTGAKTKEAIVSIMAKDQVEKFLNIVDSEKWKDDNRRDYIGITLIYLNEGVQKRDDVKKAILEEYPTASSRKYSIEYLDFLRNLCNDLKIDVSKQAIERAILDSFVYKKTLYTKERAEKYKKLFIKTGSIKDIQWYLEFSDEIKVQEVTIKKHLELLFQEDDYIDIYGDKGFDKWYSLNAHIILEGEERRVSEFSQEVRKIICWKVYAIFQENGINFDDDSVYRTLVDFIVDGSNLERLRYLIISMYYEFAIRFYIMNLINFVRHLIQNPLERSHPNTLKRKLNLPFAVDNIKEIVEYLSVHFDDFDYEGAPAKYIELIKKGYKPDRIGKILGITAKTVGVNIKKYLGMTFNEARDEYYIKPNLTRLIKEGKNVQQIADELGISRSWVFEKIKKLLGFRNLTEAQEFYENED